MTPEVHRLFQEVKNACYTVHTHLGPGLLESAYRAVLMAEFYSRGIPALQEVPIPLRYKHLDLPCAYRADIIVDNTIIIELKSVIDMPAVCHNQLRTYVRLTRLPVGILVNFGASHLKDGFYYWDLDTILSYRRPGNPGNPGSGNPV